MKNVLKNTQLVQLWKYAETPFDYIMALFISGLAALAFSGIGIVLFQLITNPSQFNNATFGIFDTLGN